MRCQEEGEGEEDDPPLVPRLGTRTGSTLLFSTTTRFSDMKQKRNYSFLTSRSIAKTSYTIRSSGVLLQTGRVFLMTFIVGVKSYMEVSNETSDIHAGQELGVVRSELQQSEDVLFHWSLIAATWDDEVAAKLMTMIVELWVTVRGFSLASAWIERYKGAMKKTLQKS